MTGKSGNAVTGSRVLPASAVLLALVEGAVLGPWFGGARAGAALPTQILVGVGVAITVCVAVAGMRIATTRQGQDRGKGFVRSPYDFILATGLGLLVAVLLAPIARPA